MTNTLAAVLVLVYLVGSVHTRAVEAPSSVYLYDLRYTAQLDRQDAFEHMHLVAATSGLVNREQAVLYSLLVDADTQWMTYLTSGGQWLNKTLFITIDNITALVETFQKSLNGVVLYDPSVYATSNLASTASGVYGLLPICYRPQDPSSLYNTLVRSGPKLQVVLDLVGMFNGSLTGSAKCDAYLWAKER